MYQQEVYADLLFLINFSMDFLCLFLTSQILHRRLYPLWAMSASAVGGIYSIISLFINIHPLFQLSTDLLVCIIICIIGFFATPRPSIKQYLCVCGVYIICASALGGFMTAAFNLLNKLKLPINSGGDNISSWLFLLLAIISGITAMKGTKFLRRMTACKITEIEILFCGQRLKLRGIVDTGNMLRDPLGGKAVIVTDIDATLPILPDSIRQAILSDKIEYLNNLSSMYSGRIRLIPSQSVTGERLLIGLIPDKIIISNNRGCTDVAAIFAPAKLNALPDNCTAIVPGELNT